MNVKVQRAIVTLVFVAILAIHDALIPRPEPPPCEGFGVTVEQQMRVLTELERSIGCRFEHVRIFHNWERLDVEFPRQLSQRDVRVDIAWQPRRFVAGREVGVGYRDIAAGRHDPYIRQFISDVKQIDGPVSIAFAPEMNGDWGAYQLTESNTPQDFIRAWRHLHRLFAREGVRVRWVWTPNILYPTQKATFAELYPGDDHVDAVGLDGYNWGTLNPWNRWKSFTETFGPSIAEVRRITRRPIELSEIASAEVGGDKAAWIRNMCNTLDRMPDVHDLTWFNVVTHTDWRVQSSEAALQAFRECMWRQTPRWQP